MAHPAFASTPAKPTYDNQQYYVESSSWTWAMNAGCSEADSEVNFGGRSGEVVLLFGAENSSGTGVYTPAEDNFLTTVQAEQVAEKFAEGYYGCAPSGYTLYLDMGTNNSGTTPTKARGVYWGNFVLAVRNWITTYAGQVAAQGANDIEPSWSSYTAVWNWAQGFASTYPGLYLSNASADGCPQTSSKNGSCNNGWNQDDLWYISYGYSPAIAAPQIYLAAQRDQWYEISLFGAVTESKAIHFIGVWDEYGADKSSWSPSTAWTQFVGKLYSNSKTAFTPQYSMELSYEA